jgi:hypothetical protein
MRSLEEVNERLRELKTDYFLLEQHCEQEDSHYEYQGELNGMYNCIKELEWVLLHPNCD